MTDPTSLPNFMPPTPRPANGSGSGGSVRDRAMAAVQSLGVEHRIDNDGDIELKLDDQIVFIRVAEPQQNGLGYIRVFGQWHLPGAGEPTQVPVSTDPLERLNRCNELTLQFPVTSFCIGETVDPQSGQATSSLIAFCESFVSDETNLGIVVPASIGHLQQGVMLFFQSWLPHDENGNPIQPDGSGSTSGADSGSAG